MRLSFRHRLFLAMIGLGTLPLAVALLVLALQVRSSSSPAGTRATVDAIAESGRDLVGAVDTTRLTPVGREAVRRHTETITRQTTLARRAERLSRYAAGALGVMILMVAIALIAASLGLARRWSRFVSVPIEELVEWVRRIERRETLPPSEHGGGAPEFEALRAALRDMAVALDLARQQELEQERLRAFRETSRRVAHEMRGPITSLKFALRRLALPSDETAAAVLQEETERLEGMAQEFSEFGRLPEGPEAEIDVTELVESAVSATVPNDMSITKSMEPGLVVRGHYEPLRRAAQNVIRNAVEVTDERGITIDCVSVDGTVRLTVVDHGPGIPEDIREHIFEPYFTAKTGGTGLGLALVRQTVTAHGGDVVTRNLDEGGAVFVITLPEAQ
jgi:signal transduction histidine kinase